MLGLQACVILYFAFLTKSISLKKTQIKTHQIFLASRAVSLVLSSSGYLKSNFHSRKSMKSSPVQLSFQISTMKKPSCCLPHFCILHLCLPAFKIVAQKQVIKSSFPYWQALSLLNLAGAKKMVWFLLRIFQTSAKQINRDKKIPPWTAGKE